MLVSFPTTANTLFAWFSATYQILFSVTAQFELVCPGVSTNARTRSPGVTAFPPSVPATDTVHRSPFSTAPADPLPQVEGNALPDAS